MLLECERIRAVAEDGFKGVWRFASRGAFCLTTALRSCLTATIYLIASLRLSITCAHRNHSSRTRTLDTGIRLLMLLFMLIIILYIGTYNFNFKLNIRKYTIIPF